MSYKVVPISSEIAGSVRENMLSPQYKHPASVAVATGYGPCRACLKKLIAGKDERILFTYNAFENLSKLPLPGPIFVHKDDCKIFNDQGFPPELLDLPLLFESYAEKSELVKREVIDRKNVDAQISQMLMPPKVKFINIRNAEAGCFVARIEMS